MKIELLIVDPQNDFCDPRGALYVAGADRDMERLAAFVKRHGKDVQKIHITLDSHHWVHIAHPIFWKNEGGEQPEPFTLIGVADVVGGSVQWQAALKEHREVAVKYVKALETNGRYQLCIWPQHCLIGTWGHNIYPALEEALQVYQEGFMPVDYIMKGSHKMTEHYSAVRADVEDPNDPSTLLNKPLIGALKAADKVIITGEALSHCVASTVRDLVEVMGEAIAREKFIILKDTMSNVSGFEELGENFMKAMEALGICITTTERYADV